MFCIGCNTEEVTVYNLYELNDAISHASFNSDTTIFIGADIAIGAGDGIEHISSSITFQPKDKDVKIYRTAENIDTYSGMFSVGSGGKLTIMGNQGYTLTLDGNKKACPNNLQPLVYVGGDFTLADGGKLVNNAAESGGGVYNRGGTFTMSGGSITGNSAAGVGGGVSYNRGTFTMSGGTISGNTAESSNDCGEVDVYRIRGGGNGVFTKKGSTLTKAPARY